MEKLECLKELSKHLSELQETKLQLKQTIKDNQDEEKIMQIFHKEKERLCFERDELVESLRQINNDINTMESVIDQTEGDRVKNIESTRRLVDDYRQRRLAINKLRTHISLPNLENDSFIENVNLSENKNLVNDWPQSNQQNIRDQMLNNSTLNILNKGSSKPTSKVPSQLNFGHHSENLQGLGERKIERSMSSAFGQQPPPMKTCMSCHQQIHRNAPICPYCKAKSRSRNPKKPKRKVEN